MNTKITKRNPWLAWLFFLTVGFAVVFIFTYNLQEDPETSGSKSVIKQLTNLIGSESSIAKPNSEEKPTKKKNGYGIAAGGGLTYLNESEIDSYFQSLHDLGVGWVRWDIDWSVIEGSGRQRFDWSGADKVVAAADKYGINSLAIIAYAPQWASQKGCIQGRQCAPADAGTFAYFAGLAASRYKGSIQYWEIWNEPNTTGFWSPKPDPVAYAEILKVASLKIKSVDPTAFVVSGGLAPSYDEKGGSISPISFIKKMYSVGANNYFDAVGLHPYSYPALPGHKIYWNSWQQMSSIRKIMDSNNDKGKKIWITEYGAPTSGPGSKKNINQFKFNSDIDYMTEQAQADILKEAASIYGAKIDWFGPFFWYSLKDMGTEKNTLENFFGLLRYDGSKKPAYYLYNEIILKNEQKK